MFKEKRTSSNSPGCLVGFALLWLAISTPIFLIAVQDSETFAIIFAGLFVFIGLAILGFALLNFYTRIRVGKPEILLSKSTLSVGESFYGKLYAFICSFCNCGRYSPEVNF